jgi:tRNA 2-thiouridine synthesizing protein C
MGSAFAECAVLFQGDGVYQLLKHQQPERLGTKNFASTFGALADYGVDQIFCIDEDLEKRQLGTDELVIPTIPIKQNTVCEFISAFDLVLDF